MVSQVEFFALNEITDAFIVNERRQILKLFETDVRRLVSPLFQEKLVPVMKSIVIVGVDMTW